MIGSSKENTIGIDFGTLESSVAVYVNGGVQIVPNQWGNRTIPSYVAFTDDEILVGEAAKNQVGFNQAMTIFEMKSFFWKRLSDDAFKQKLKNYPFKLQQGNKGHNLVVVKHKGEQKFFSFEEITGMLFRKLKKQAEDLIAEPVTHAVITVPSFFESRESIKAAASSAGLEVRRMINESTAACIAYQLDKQTPQQWFYVVVNIGATVTVDVLGVQDGVFEIKATATQSEWGCKTLDGVLIDHCCDEFQKKNNLSLRSNQRAMRRLTAACERGKKVLSSAMQMTIEVDSIIKDIDFVLSISRALFETLAAPYLDKLIPQIQKALLLAKLPKNQIADIVLCGGGAKIPRIQVLIKKLFDRQALKFTMNPHQVVAYGAARQAYLLSQPINPDNLLVCFHMVVLSLGVQTAGGLMTPVLMRNRTIPGKSTLHFTTLKDHQKFISIRIFLGERPLAKDCHLIAAFLLKDLEPARGGQPRISITFEISSEDALIVSAKDLGSGSSAKINILQYNSKLTVDKVEFALKQSQIYKEKDQKMRAKLKLQNEYKNYLNYTDCCLQSETAQLVLGQKERHKIMTEINKAYKQKSAEDGFLVIKSLFRPIIKRIEESGGAGADWSGLSEWKNMPSIPDEL